jgi:hypothetical protein
VLLGAMSGRIAGIKGKSRKYDTKNPYARRLPNEL